jgi:hypothetical protein
MPHKVTNDSSSSLASKGSGDSTDSSDSSDQVIVTEVLSMSIIIVQRMHTTQTPTYPGHRGNPRSGSKLTTPLPTVPVVNSNTAGRRQPPVIVHNKGGQIYDETRPSDWDKQRWK